MSKPWIKRGVVVVTAVVVAAVAWRYLGRDGGGIVYETGEVDRGGRGAFSSAEADHGTLQIQTVRNPERCELGQGQELEIRFAECSQ